MKQMMIASSAAGFLLTALGTYVSAQEVCAVNGDPWDLDDDDAIALYDCMEARMAAGYATEGDPVAAAYRSWASTSTRPAVAGPHGERLLNTFANEIAAEQYLAFTYGDFEMPVGSVLAKESIAVRDGNARVGPLFIMTKVENAVETDGWFYTAVQPNGRPMRISQSFCHDCHAAFENSDSMGYPLEDVRLSTSQ